MLGSSAFSPSGAGGSGTFEARRACSNAMNAPMVMITACSAVRIDRPSASETRP